jgi:hypothetical protein
MDDDVLIDDAVTESFEQSIDEDEEVIVTRTKELYQFYQGLTIKRKDCVGGNYAGFFGGLTETYQDWPFEVIKSRITSFKDNIAADCQTKGLQWLTADKRSQYQLKTSNIVYNVMRGVETYAEKGTRTDKVEKYCRGLAFFFTKAFSE